ncbi:MAG TPA: DUF4112 domain-containing protein [Gemmatimonadaceae bacterium]|nr:DUF4112 domain-containing protein [Gemmatimonadaceae bacterium]
MSDSPEYELAHSARMRPEDERSAARHAPPATRALSRLLDEAIRIPGTNIRVGLDPLLGLVPGLGDVVGGALSGYVIILASRHGAPPSVLTRMLGNVLIDSVVGSVPVLGDLFDVGWKANSRNLALLDRHLEQPSVARRSSRAVLAAVLVALALAVAGGIAATVWVIRELVR